MNSSRRRGGSGAVSGASRDSVTTCRSGAALRGHRAEGCVPGGGGWGGTGAVEAAGSHTQAGRSSRLDQLLYPSSAAQR